MDKDKLIKDLKNTIMAMNKQLEEEVRYLLIEK